MKVAKLKRTVVAVGVAGLAMALLRPDHASSTTTLALIGQAHLSADWMIKQLGSPQLPEGLSKLASHEPSDERALIDLAYRLQPEGRVQCIQTGGQTVEIQVRAKNQRLADWVCRAIPIWLRLRLRAEVEMQTRPSEQLSSLAEAEESVQAAEARLQTLPSTFAEARYGEAYEKLLRAKLADQDWLAKTQAAQPEILVLTAAQTTEQNLGFGPLPLGKR